MGKKSDIAIIGGGIIGLSIAFRLAGDGRVVTVIDNGQPGQASWAAAGMLAPFAESSGPGPFVDLALRSLALYSGFVDEVRAASGIDPELDNAGILRVARSEEEEDALCRAFAWQSEMDLPLSRLTGDQARCLEPALSPDIRAAVLSPTEWRVAPRSLLAALRTACGRRGVTFCDGPIDAGMPDDARIAILCAGAWSPDIAVRFELPRLPVRPVKGQILALGPFDPLPIRHTVFTHGAYLVPRRDGTIILGATEEDDGSFDACTTEEAVHRLMRGLKTLSPALAGAPVQSVWAGLRPVSPDGLPVIDRTTGVTDIIIAAGHGRNGILLAPVTADLIARHLDGAPLPPECRLDRFMEEPCLPLS
jgi:glycine oxidase